MKTKLFLLSTLVALLDSCNSDVQLYDYEDTPKVEEHLLGLTKSEAEKYLAKQGFLFVLAAKWILWMNLSIRKTGISLNFPMRHPLY